MKLTINIEQTQAGDILVHVQRAACLSTDRKLKPGQCAECAVVHKSEEPHNQQSLLYQYSFREQHGRWPTWHDAMRHCTPGVKKITLDVLSENNVELKPDDAQ